MNDTNNVRNRNTLEFIGIWEELHNPDFKGHEFVTFKSQAIPEQHLLVCSKLRKPTKPGVSNIKHHFGLGLIVELFA